MQSLVGNDNFTHILRVLNTNVDGKQKIMYALTAIKGMGRRFSNICCKKAEVDLTKRCGGRWGVQGEPPRVAQSRRRAVLGGGARAAQPRHSRAVGYLVVSRSSSKQQEYLVGEWRERHAATSDGHSLWMTARCSSCRGARRTWLTPVD